MHPTARPLSRSCRTVSRGILRYCGQRTTAGPGAGAHRCASSPLYIRGPVTPSTSERLGDARGSPGPPAGPHGGGRQRRVRAPDGAPIEGALRTGGGGATPDQLYGAERRRDLAPLVEDAIGDQ